VRLRDLTFHQIGQPLTGHTDGVASMAFSPDGATLATGGSDTDKTVRLWNVTTPLGPRQIGQPLTGHARGVISMAFSPDGATLATGSNDKAVRLWAVH
jgi:WD40 repeat protein